MLQILTKEQSNEMEKRTDDVLTSLDYNIKSALIDLLIPILQQRDCDHDWVDYDSYENQMPKNSKGCRKCNLIRKK
jgi:hypothetical protein